MKKGNYFGTEIDGKWWRRYRGHGFFARGNGEFDMSESGISFRKLLTKEPLLIDWHEVTGASLGKWHSGRWAGGQPILRVAFARDNLLLSAGFKLSDDWTEMEQLAADLQRRSTR